MKIIGEYGYVTKDAKNYHVYGDKTDSTQDKELVYRVDTDKL